jgi:hypothetical protein
LTDGSKTKVRQLRKWNCRKTIEGDGAGRCRHQWRHNDEQDEVPPLDAILALVRYLESDDGTRRCEQFYTDADALWA